jgi:4-hydroxybenzoyl-CoA thioesterase
VVASLSVGEAGRAAAERAFTIRFPQVDPAGIVFYPRYFEMVYRCFPALPFGQAPLGIKTQFLKPNRLGDRLSLHFEAGRLWSVTGRFGDAEHFSMRAVDVAPPSPHAHRASTSAFTTTPQPVGDWMADTHGCMSLSRYFECLNVAIEEWFEFTLSIPFHLLHVGRRVGIPTVQFDTNLASLPALGERFAIRLEPQRIGSRAMTFRSWLIRDDECLVENRQVVVFVRMLDDGYESIDIPDDVRRAFCEQLTEDNR